MKKKAPVRKPLALSLETIRQLSTSQLPYIVGGAEPSTSTDTCTAYDACTKH